MAVIGDVHGQWHAADVVALHQLGADCVLFVGDFGEEDLKLVTGIANIDHPKAVILGNHDAWCSTDTVPVTRTVCPAPQPSFLCLGAEGRLSILNLQLL